MSKRVASSKRTRRRNLFDAPSNGPPSELMGCVSRFRVDLLRAPLEPAPLSLDATSEAITCPLSLRIAAPRALTARDVTFDVSQPWCHPFRFVRVAVHVPVEYESLGSSDWSAAIGCFMCNIRRDSDARYSS